MRNGLSAIIGGFEKTLRRLEAFQKTNGAQIAQDREALELKEREQRQAETIATNIKEFLDVRNDSE